MGIKKLLGDLLNDAPEVWLKRFNKEHSKKKSVADIPYGVLKEWGNVNWKSNGKYVLDFMSPEVWGHSAKSLFTAAEIIRTQAAALAKQNKAIADLVFQLEQEGLRRMKEDYEAKHGTIKEQVTKKSRRS